MHSWRESDKLKKITTRNVNLERNQLEVTKAHEPYACCHQKIMNSCQASSEFVCILIKLFEVSAASTDICVVTHCSVSARNCYFVFLLHDSEFISLQEVAMALVSFGAPNICC